MKTLFILEDYSFGMLDWAGFEARLKSSFVTHLAEDRHSLAGQAVLTGLKSLLTTCNKFAGLPFLCC